MDSLNNKLAINTIVILLVYQIIGLSDNAITKYMHLKNV